MVGPDEFNDGGPDIAEFYKSDAGRRFKELDDRMSAIKLVVDYQKSKGII